MNWRAQGLQREGDHYLFKALPGQLTLAALINAVGYGALAIACFILVSARNIGAAAFAATIAGMFLLANRWFRARGVRGVSIDVQRKVIEMPVGLFDKSSRKITWSDVGAIQYLPYKKHGPANIILAELNLILRSGERLSLVHHNDRERMRSDGEQLARVLNVPFQAHGIWRLK